MTRFWRFTLLTLIIALLPLRGWVGSVMPVAVAAQASASEQAGESPCHGHEASSITGHHAQTCAQCDLCHAGVITSPSWAWHHAAPPDAAPSWSVNTVNGRDGTDGLFRPPRA